MHRFLTLAIQKRLSMAVLVTGAALAGMMIYTESEPGAIPLLLILIGLAWRIIVWLVARQAGM